MNELGLVQPDDRLNERIVVGVTDAAHQGLDSRLSEPLGAAARDLLNAAIAVMDQRTMRVTTLMQCLPKRSSSRSPDLPTYRGV